MQEIKLLVHCNPQIYGVSRSFEEQGGRSLHNTRGLWRVAHLGNQMCIYIEYEKLIPFFMVYISFIFTLYLSILYFILTFITHSHSIFYIQQKQFKPLQYSLRTFQWFPLTISPTVGLRSSNCYTFCIMMICVHDQKV